MIARKYIHREILRVLLPSLLILVVIFLSSATVKYLNYAARGDISIHYFPKLLMIELPGLLGILLPIAFFFACLIALSRMCAQNELITLRVSGLNPMRLTRIVFSLAIPLAFFVALFIFGLRPHLLTLKAHLLVQAKANALIDMFKPGQFQTLPGKASRTVFVDKMQSEQQKVEGVFVATQNDQSADPDVITAKSGYHETIDDADYFVFEQGALYHGQPGERNYRVIRFKRYKTLIKPPSTALPRDKVEMIPTLELLKHPFQSSEVAAELQWRLSIPIMLLILAWIAIPLSDVPPRTGVYANILPALLLLIIYINGVLVLRDKIEDAVLDSKIGLWWFHAVFWYLGYLLMRRKYS